MRPWHWISSVIGRRSPSELGLRHSARPAVFLQRHPLNRVSVKPRFEMTEMCRWALLCSLLVTCFACSSQGWEDYMEAGYEAQQSGRLVEAEEMLLVAVQYAEAFGVDDIRRATTLDNLADVYRAQQREGDAEGLYRQALEIRSQILGPQHQRVAMGLGNLARFYDDQGSYAAAEPLYWRALEISEVNLGPGHPDVATLVGALAALYHLQDEYADAEPLYQRALRIREQTLGPDDASVAEILEGYADLIERTGRESAALAMKARARAIRPDEFVPLERP